MAQKPEIQYIERFFVPGAEAPQVQPRWGAKPEKAAVVQPRKEPKVRIIVDPVALAGLAVAVVMLVLMAVGVFQFHAVNQEHQEVEDYLTELRDQNLELKHDYYSNLDLEWIEEQALALGMVPAEQAQRITMDVTVPQREPEPTWWENVLWFLEGLFA